MGLFSTYSRKTESVGSFGPRLTPRDILEMTRKHSVYEPVITMEEGVIGFFNDGYDLDLTLSSRNMERFNESFIKLCSSSIPSVCIVREVPIDGENMPYSVGMKKFYEGADLFISFPDSVKGAFEPRRKTRNYVYNQMEYPVPEEEFNAAFSNAVPIVEDARKTFGFHEISFLRPAKDSKIVSICVNPIHVDEKKVI